MLRRGNNQDQTSPLGVLNLIRGLPASFTPGTDCNYSNTGYVLLGLVAESVGGRPMEELYQERIFAPLRMKSTYFDPVTPAHPGIARGYVLYQGNLLM